MSQPHILALDQGTTSSRAIVFDALGRVRALAQQEFTQHFPRPGWVEHDAREIWRTQLAVARAALAQLPAGTRVAALGLTNQRETTVLWDRATGEPVAPAIVWQDRRTAADCERLRAAGHAREIQRKTGLVLDAYFSGTKVKWILDNVEGAREKAERGELLFGTIDTWLIWKMTNGEVHVTDPTNASRTMLYNIRDLQWDGHILQELGIPASMLPEVRPSSEIYGYTTRGGGAHIPIAGIAGDQQAALFGQLCFEKGMAKNTYGTGCFLLMNTGETPVKSDCGLLTTIAVGPTGNVNYALEGSVFMGGATIQWLRDELRLIDDATDTGYFAGKVKDSNGVYLVPAFVGLGAPYWDPYARGAIVGLTRGANRNHIIRAALESIAYQSRDVLDAMQKDSGIRLASLKVDGGAVANDFLMQFQSDIMGTTVVRPKLIETTALGAAFLAGLAVGFWKSTAELSDKFSIDREFEPTLPAEQREQLYAGWQKAVTRSQHWVD